MDIDFALSRIFEDGVMSGKNPFQYAQVAHGSLLGMRF